MKKLIAAISFTVFLAIPFGVQAGDIDGKALLCGDIPKEYPKGSAAYEMAAKQDPIGLVFDKGEVVHWFIEGYRKKKTENIYTLRGSNTVYWRRGHSVERDTLLFYDRSARGVPCSLSSKEEIFKKLDERIARAKKSNKL